MTLAAYTGHETLTFPDYLDLGTGRTLTAEPGRSYDVAPASGRAVPEVPAGWFTPLEGEAPAEAADVPEAAAEPEGEPGSGEPEQS